MAESTKTPPGPLAIAAAAIETELKRWEDTSAELDRISLTSEKTLKRAAKVLEECAVHQQKLATLLPELAQVMQIISAKQQECMVVTGRGMDRIKEHFEARRPLVESLQALGQKAHEFNTATVMPEGAPADTEVLKVLERIGAQAETLVAEASSLHEASLAANCQDIAREADAIRQQLQAARNKVLVAQRSVAARAPS